ncbi:MAG: hypothetical protein KAI35_10095, partial [Desulfobulbaceae bacterium]|nr:hypothetical protein [Desulfobulbaceae bacterium]
WSCVCETTVFSNSCCNKNETYTAIKRVAKAATAPATRLLDDFPTFMNCSGNLVKRTLKKMFVH